jgi:hypothetical protein
VGRGKLNETSKVYKYSSLTAWSRVLLEKPLVAQLVKVSFYLTLHPDVHYFAQESQPLVSAPCQMNAVHTLISIFFKFYFNIIITGPSRPSFIRILSHVRYMFRASRFIDLKTWQYFMRSIKYKGA